MEDKPTSVPPQCSVVIHEDISEAENLKPMACPLCRSRLKLYQIHYDEKFLMCANIDCVYPFGLSDYHIYKIECNEEFVRKDARSSIASATSSITTHSDWSELDRMTVDNPLSPSPVTPVEKPQDIEKLEKVKKIQKNEEMIKQNVIKIKKLNKQLFELDALDTINNEEWIKHIAKMQGRSGVQLLKENELCRLKKIGSTLDNGKLTIDIDSTKNEISLKVENVATSETKET